jgi:hypothetical protein
VLVLLLVLVLENSAYLAVRVMEQHNCRRIGLSFQRRSATDRAQARRRARARFRQLRNLDGVDSGSYPIIQSLRDGSLLFYGIPGTSYLATLMRPSGTISRRAITIEFALMGSRAGRRTAFSEKGKQLAIAIHETDCDRRGRRSVRIESQDRRIFKVCGYPGS